MAYVRTTKDEFQLWINYGQGWEHETTEATRRAAVDQRKTYRDNCPEYPTKIMRKRVPIAQE